MSKFILLRIAFSLLAGLAVAFLVSEGSYYLLKRNQDRQPEEIVLTIPAGTASRVAAGENPPAIPADMIFIVGDTLRVVNEDAANHQLGPLYIPAQATATLSFEAVQNYDYACSFRTNKYFGVTVQKAITIFDRVTGVIFAGLPLGVLIALYAIFAVAPAGKREAA